ncbi:MAG: ribonuclease Z [Gemmataceae bacterium]
MSSRHVTFLGTSSQVPTRARNHNALFLQWDEFGLLVDPGEGTQRQMLQAGLSASQITHILITHFHGDHCLGLAGIIQRLSLDRVPHPVEVIYPASGQVYFERLRHASSFYEVATLVPRPITASAEAAVQVARLGKATLLAQSLEHGIECQGYRLQEDDGRRMLPERLAAAGLRGPAVGRLQAAGQVEIEGRIVRLEEVSERRPGQAVAVVMDTRACIGASGLASGVDLLVCEATYQQESAREAWERGHMTATAAAELAAQAGARRLALTHFSQRYQTLDGFRAEAGALHGDVFCADDLTRIEVPARRESAS